jgi:hypothetical protein
MQLKAALRGVKKGGFRDVRAFETNVRSCLETAGTIPMMMISSLTTNKLD